MGMHRGKPNRSYIKEITGSLPLVHNHTTESVPDDIPKEHARDIATGDDSPNELSSALHSVLGILAWLGWIIWTVHTWLFTGAPATDLVIAALIWAFAYVVTILLVPMARRWARHRGLK